MTKELKLLYKLNKFGKEELWKSELLSTPVLHCFLETKEKGNRVVQTVKIRTVVRGSEGPSFEFTYGEMLKVEWVKNEIRLNVDC